MSVCLGVHWGCLDTLGVALGLWFGMLAAALGLWFGMLAAALGLWFGTLAAALGLLFGTQGDGKLKCLVTTYLILCMFYGAEFENA